MNDNITTAYEDKNNSDNTTSLLSDLTNIEVECKLEPSDHELTEDSPTYVSSGNY